MNPKPDTKALAALVEAAALVDAKERVQPIIDGTKPTVECQ